jgi:antitoxin component YwqK of YwqJK toxin-antitoxin module
MTYLSKSLAFVIIASLFSSCHRSEPDNFLVGIQIQDRNGISETISIPDRLETYKQVDFLSSQPFKKVIRVYKKEGKNHSIITTYHPNGFIWQYLEAQDMRAYGLYQEWFFTGQVKIKAHVIGGTADVSPGAQSDWLFDGISEVWDEQGRLAASIPYEKGVLQGTSLHFYPTQQTHLETPYHQNLLEGEWTEYYPDGTTKEKTVYSKGIKTGKSIGYSSLGKLCWTEEYKNDFLQKGSYFSAEGDLVSSVSNGFGFQTFFDDLCSFQQIEVQKGKQEGIIKQFTSNKELRLIYKIKNGKKQGEEIEYYSFFDLEDQNNAPSPKISIQWDQDAIHGSVKTWYSNGSLESQKEWARNKKNGASCSWYQDGSLMLIEEYEEDILMKGKYFKKHMKEPISTILQGNGLATLYDDQGVFLRKIVYQKGKPIDPES